MTLRDVAALAGVHLGTASRALDPARRSIVSDATRERVAAAAQELGYSMDVVARSLRRRQTTTVGVVVGDIAMAFVAPILRGVVGHLEEEGFMVFVSETLEQQMRLVATLDSFVARKVDAVIVTGAHLADGAVLQSVVNRGVPVVLAVRSVAGVSIPTVKSDDIEGGHSAGRHLCGLGHVEIAQIRGPADIQPFLDREVGFGRALTEAGVTPVRFVERATASSVEEGARMMRLVLAERDQPPTAVFAHTDALAVGAMTVLREAGLACPGDVSVIGYNDAPLTDQLSAPLTTIRFPMELVGRNAAELAMRLIDDPDTPVASLSFAPELVVRASTAPPRKVR